VATSVSELQTAMSSIESHSRSASLQRVLFVITDLDVGGAEKCCVQLATGLDRARWHAQVCCLSGPGVLGERLRVAGIPVHTLRAANVWNAPGAIWELSQLMHRLRPTIVHTFLFHANMVGRLAGWLTAVPRILSSIRVAERRFRYHLILENMTCRFSHKVVCVSDAVARFTRRRSHVPASRLVVIPNGVELQPNSSAPAPDRSDVGLSHDSIVALYVGRLDPQKGVDVLLRALAIARSNVANLHLLVAGSGLEHSSLVGLAQQLGLESHVHFLGWRDDVSALMHAADFFVMPSRWEGMPNAVLEAMAAGLPVIATRAEGSAELVRNGETGRLVAIDDEKELASAIVELAHDPALRAVWGKRGQATARTEYSLSTMLGRYDQLYESLLS
jgi:glycosyltransferase involved in cell wall biosynthesis